MLLALVLVQMGQELGQEACLGEGQPAAAQLTPCTVLSVLMLPPYHILILPPNLQTDFLCYPRLLALPLWALKSLPHQRLESLRNFQGVWEEASI